MKQVLNETDKSWGDFDFILSANADISPLQVFFTCKQMGKNAVGEKHKHRHQFRRLNKATPISNKTDTGEKKRSTPGHQ